MKSMFPSLLRAKDPISLYNEVCNAIKDGKDLHAPLFADGNGVLCQFVVPSLCLYEYRLIEALDVDDLETQVQSLANLGFDFMFSTVQWNGKYLQWMARMNESGAAVKEVVTSFSEELKSLDAFNQSVASAFQVPTEIIEGANRLTFIQEAVPLFRHRLMGDQ